jgi:Ca-activated chloride channel homolog
MRQRLAFVVTAVTLGCGGFDSRTPVLAQDPGAVTIEAKLQNSLLPADQPSEVVVRLRVRAPDAERLGRPKVNLALVLDNSHSMEGDALDDIKRASLALIESLQPGDHLALIVFSSKTEILVPSTPLTSASIAELRRKVSHMKAWGTTDLEGGLAAGVNEVTKHYDAAGINRVVLLGDGVPNDASNIVPLAQAAGERGVPVTALGFGLEYDETLMAQIAQRSGGRFHFVEHGSEIAAVFRDEVLRLERTVAKNMMITITPGPGMAVTRIIGHPVAGGPGRKVAFGIGSLSSGQTLDLVVRLQSQGRRDGMNVEVLDAELAFEEVLAGAGRVDRRIYVPARATADLDRVRESFDIDVARSMARMEAADAVIQSIALARTGQVDQGKALLVAAEQEARASAKRLSDADLVKHADGMRPLRDALLSLVQQAQVNVTADAAGGVGAPSAAPAAESSTVKRSHDEATSILSAH